MPKLYYFNPEHDMALANGSSNFTPPESATFLSGDLSLLPCWYAETGGVVLSDQTFPEEYNPINLDIKTVAPFTTDLMKECKAEPWGWDLAVRKYFIQNGVDPHMLPSEAYINKIKELSHRRIASKAMQYLRDEACDKFHFPEPAIEYNNISDVISHIKSSEEVVIKAPWSSSGKGIYWINKVLMPSNEGWCKRVIEKQGSIMIEKAYERVRDFAMEFRLIQGEVLFAGYSLFYTEGTGIYRGNRLLSNEAIVEKLNKWVSTEELDWVKEKLTVFFKNNIAPYYSGYIGVDMFIYQEGENYYLNPMVEINLRMTMGMVARILYDRYVYRGSEGMFVIDHLPPGELLEHHNSRYEAQKMECRDNKFYKGYFSLCPISDNTLYRASIILE